MRATNALLATASLVIGLLLVIISIPVAYSGVGGVGASIFTGCPGGGCGNQAVPPSGAISVRFAYGYLYIEPAFFVGLGLLAVGIFLMWESIKILGIRTGRKPDLPVGLRR